MFENDYDGILELWKARLLVRLARRMGFSGADLEDAQQEIILDVLAFEFDEQNSNGTTEPQQLAALINARLKNIRRAEGRYRERLERLQALTNGEFIEPDRQPMRADVQAALDDLEPRDRDTCTALAGGKTILQIAKERGCSWHTVERQVKRIREHFMAIRLDGWLQEG